VLPEKIFHCTEDLNYYSLSEIARATIKDEANALDYRGRNPFPVKDLLLFDPQNTTSRELLSELISAKHCLDELVRGQVLEMLIQGETLHINFSVHRVVGTAMPDLFDWLET